MLANKLSEAQESRNGAELNIHCDLNILRALDQAATQARKAYMVAAELLATATSLGMAMILGDISSATESETEPESGPQTGTGAVTHVAGTQDKATNCKPEPGSTPLGAELATHRSKVRFQDTDEDLDESKGKHEVKGATFNNWQQLKARVSPLHKGLQQEAARLDEQFKQAACHPDLQESILLETDYDGDAVKDILNSISVSSPENSPALLQELK
ncbi:hypothetical protein EST38_g7551 [Candolleomyces aberdarensis]|uniref:Uncharacterized protein n=1 Tax=Candolleomyces aberdarensis TaxID=2316362 RepID=A0A4Q2DFD2_9AGAR|nr:hypothetical protein EST38_g7551 [Candolleomyces aberdarensis]